MISTKRLYFSDLTPDNIVVDSRTMQTTFVDFDHLLIVDSNVIKSNVINKHERIKCSQSHFAASCFAFAPEELCAVHLSDINIVSILQVSETFKLNLTSMLIFKKNENIFNR